MDWLTTRLPAGISWLIVSSRIGISGARLVSVRKTVLGYALELRLNAPTTIDSVSSFCDQIAVAYGAARVRVSPNEAIANRVTLFIDFQRGIGTAPYVPEPNPVGIPLNPLRAIPLGLNDEGDVVAVRLFGKHVLVGGNPGSGKSVALRVFLAGLAASRDVSIVGIDPKHTELVMWKSRLSNLIVGNGVDDVVALLEEMLGEIQKRAKHLAATGSATLFPTSEFPWIVLVIDEWAELAAQGDVKQRNSVSTLLRRYLSLGRAVGCTAILCTQRPTSDTVDTGTRALTSFRFALKCGDRYQAEAILGIGAFSPEQLIGASPGRALWSDGGIASAVQFYNVTDDQIPALTHSPFRISFGPGAESL